MLVVASVIVENDLAGSGFGNGDVATMDDGILGIDARRVLRHSNDMELRFVRLGSSCKASMNMYGQGRHLLMQGTMFNYLEKKWNSQLVLFSLYVAVSADLIQGTLGNKREIEQR